MAEYLRPRRVVVDEGGAPVPAIAGAIIVAAVVSAAATFIESVLLVVLIALGVACAAGIVVFVVLLRRSGAALSGPQGLRPAVATRAPVAGGVRPAAIAPPRVVPGVVLGAEDTAERR